MSSIALMASDNLCPLLYKKPGFAHFYKIVHTFLIWAILLCGQKKWAIGQVLEKSWAETRMKNRRKTGKKCPKTGLFRHFLRVFKQFSDFCPLCPLFFANSIKS